jgi:beta-galactosidase
VNPTLRRLVKFVRREEPTRAVTAALVNSNAKTLKQRVRRVLSAAKLMDVLSVNYQEPLFSHYRAADPKVVICASESFKHWRGGEMNVHSFDPRNPWYDAARHDYVVGQFLWPGFDYLGESNHWPLKGWNLGILDTCGFFKPEAWFHRSVWRAEPVVRIAVLAGGGKEGETASSWSAPAMVEHWNLGALATRRLVRLQTQTNCETVELVLNGRSYGVRRAADFLNSAVPWFIPYELGTIEAIGRNDGKIVARHALRTTGPAARIELVVDRAALRADGQDVAHVEVRLVDKHGVLVPDDDRKVAFSVTGPAVILGVDNGDLASDESYRGCGRMTVGGRCLVIIRSTREGGTIGLAASAENLGSAVARLRATKAARGWPAREQQ